MNSSIFILLKRILSQVRTYWPHIIFLFALNLLAAPIALLKPFALKTLIDSGFGSSPVPYFIRIFLPLDFEYSFSNVVIIAAALVIIIALIENLYGIALWVLEAYTGEKLVLSFRILLFNHIQRISLIYHDTKGTSDSLYRIQWDTMRIRSFLITQVSPLISSFITLISMIVIMFLINWHFALISVCVIPPLFVLTRLSTKRLKKNWRKVKEDESLAMSVIHEVLNSLRVVKAFGQEENESRRFMNRADEAIKGQIKVAWAGSVFNLIVGIIFAIATALFIYLGAEYVHTGKMTLGELVLVLAYLAQVFGPLQSISKNLNEIQSSVASIDRVVSVLDHEKEVQEDPHAIHLIKANGSFEFKNVSFSYNERNQILKNISFEIKPGDRAGIMGSTGAGKSTLISLLNRFYDPNEGMICIDGTDIKKYKLVDYRNQFAIVLQEPVLFSTSIKENIRYGKPESSDKEIIEAAKSANAYDFIINLKDGFDTSVGDRGMQLSGGERQRIALARAFIKNAPVLILDEPTSSVDVKTESQIIESMNLLMKGRTTFMITHRLDTLHSCNIILHIEQGKLLNIYRSDDPAEFKLKMQTLFKNMSSEIQD
jgi:ATP-binding cassette subfamily B protein